jgi:acyl dehydratase
MAGRSTFPTPPHDRYFEDYQPGETYEFPDAVTLHQQRIIEFGTEFDPQPFHIDPDSAADGPYGGLIASGWHTAAILMRLFATNYLSPVASLASPGVDEVRWLAPVRPDDTLHLRAIVLDTKRSVSKPDRGVLRTRLELLNQHDDVVLRMDAINLILLRHP